jgi:pyridoxamine 5'-phosphate oxidase-like protein
MALTIGPRLQGFFDEVLPAILTTLNDRGAPEMTPVWYEFADGQIWLNGARTRRWLNRMEETGRATFFVMDPTDFWRWAQVWGKVVEAADDPGGAHINRLAHRYRGGEYTGDRSSRRLLKIEITSVKGAAGSPNREKWDATE